MASKDTKDCRQPRDRQPSPSRMQIRNLHPRKSCSHGSLNSKDSSSHEGSMIALVRPGSTKRPYSPRRKSKMHSHEHDAQKNAAGAAHGPLKSGLDPEHEGLDITKAVSNAKLFGVVRFEGWLGPRPRHNYSATAPSVDAVSALRHL